MSTDFTDPDLPYWVAWTFVVGPPRQLKLLEHFGSLAIAWHSELGALTELLGGDALGVWQKRQALDPLACWQRVQHPDQQILSWNDLRYPARLRELTDPPPVLYVRGVLPDLAYAVAIVGARRARDYGKAIARRFAHELATLGSVVVSGAAAGIDTAAHRGALEAPGAVTVAVLGCGLGTVYPPGREHEALYRQIARRGALVTECRPYEGPEAHHFPKRNRLIAALTRGVVVVEAAAKSGSLITARCANDLGRSVMAVPGDIHAAESQGPHALLRDGARLVTKVEDILDELQLVATPVAQAPPKDPLEAHLYTLLARGPSTLDTLLAISGLSYGQAIAALLRLELAGRILKQPGPRYVLSS